MTGLNRRAMKTGIMSIFIMAALLLTSLDVDAQGRGKKKGHYKHKHNKVRYYEGDYYRGYRAPRPPRPVYVTPPAPRVRHLPPPPLPPHPSRLPHPPVPPHPFR